MNRLVTTLLLVGALTAGCAAAPPRTLPAPAPGPTSPQTADSANPTVTPPKGEIKVATDLLVENAPSTGYITADEARTKAVAAMAKSHEYGTLTLTALRFDTVSKLWEAEFTTDGRFSAAPGSHPSEHTSDDPIEQRRQYHSWVSLASSLFVAVDGKTGEIRGGGFTGGKMDLTRPDLEHYRGVIVDGGDVVKLRLTRADGSREGRDLEVSIPQDALTAAGLSLWQVMYGAGRPLEVWGLSSRPSVVVAYKVAMPTPPPDSVLAAPLFRDVPLYPNAYIKDETIQVKGADLKAVQDWYRAQLPLYGFKPAKPDGDYENGAWDHIHLTYTTTSDGVQLAITRP